MINLMIESNCKLFRTKFLQKLILVVDYSQKMNVDLMKHFDDEDIWQESFWVYRETLVKCLTLNSLIPMLKKPDDVYVCQSQFI